MRIDQSSPFLRRIAAWLMVLSVCLATGVVTARDQGLGDVVARLPDSVEFVAALDDAATLRGSLVDSPLMLALSSMTRPARIIDAWSALSADLRMTGDEAFDLLLGQRVVFLASGLMPGEAQTSWALLSELDPVTERRLRVDLGAVPRRLIAGQVVLELEHGNFLMATSNGRLRCAADGRFEPTPDSTILLLAPSEDREFFEALLPLLHCQPAAHPLGDLPGGAAVRTLPSGDGVLLWRMPDPELAPDRFIAASLRFDAGAWRFHAVAGPPSGWVPETDPSTITPWSPRTLATLPDAPAFAMMGLRSVVQEARQVVVPMVTSPLPGADTVSLDPLLGDRSLIAVWLDEAHDGGGPSVEMLSATEVKDLETVASRAREIIEAGTVPNQANWTIHEDAPIAGSTPDMQMLRLTPGPGSPASAPEINWAFVPEAGKLAGGRGWWLVHQGAIGDAPRATGLTGGRTGDSHDGIAPTRRYLHAGVARPHALVASQGATDVGMDLLPGGSVVSMLMSRIDKLEWAVWASEDGRALEADLVLYPPLRSSAK
ncbi:MAG: hypothetical protein IPJ41_05180 [Phycisphaerales bacterium]|nr:hypothetical protein [Phycisphaerales bacterium]